MTLDEQIVAINALLKPLYVKQQAGDTSVDDQINTLVKKRTYLESQSIDHSQLTYDWQAAKDYITTDLTKVTANAVNNIGTTIKSAASGIFSFTKWIVVAIIIYFLIKLLGFI